MTPHPSAYGCHLPPLGKAIFYSATIGRPFKSVGRGLAPAVLNKIICIAWSAIGRKKCRGFFMQNLVYFYYW